MPVISPYRFQMFDIFARIEEDFSLLNRRAVFALVYTAIGLTCISYLKNADYMNAMASAVAHREAVSRRLTRTRHPATERRTTTADDSTEVPSSIERPVRRETVH